MTTKLQLDMTDRLQLGARLKVLREGKALTVLQAAECLLGYNGSHAAVSRLERGVLTTVPLVHLKKLAKGYGVPLKVLTNGVRAVAPDTVGKRDTFWQTGDLAPGFANRFRDLRQALGLTHAEMGELIGHANDTQVRGWERDTVTPRMESMLDIAARTGVCVSWLVKGAREGLSRPTQAARLRALRARAGLSRPALAMKADPTQFTTLRAQLSAAEQDTRELHGVSLEKMAQALDVPVQWLTPSGVHVQAQPKPVTAADVLALLPVSVRGLLKQIEELAYIDQFTTEDAAALSKALTARACKRLSGKAPDSISLPFGATVSLRCKSTQLGRKPGPGRPRGSVKGGLASKPAKPPARSRARAV
jgi:transcriptional regulator with XRE-family HTH domain